MSPCASFCAASNRLVTAPESTMAAFRSRSAKSLPRLPGIFESELRNALATSGAVWRWWGRGAMPLAKPPMSRRLQRAEGVAQRLAHVLVAEQAGGGDDGVVGPGRSVNLVGEVPTMRPADPATRRQAWPSDLSGRHVRLVARQAPGRPRSRRRWCCPEPRCLRRHWMPNGLNLSIAHRPGQRVGGGGGHRLVLRRSLSAGRPSRPTSSCRRRRAGPCR